MISLLDIPTDVWKFGIFEYLLGPINLVDLPNDQSIDTIWSFQDNVYPIIKYDFKVHHVRAVHLLCCSVSKKLSEFLVHCEEMEEFWLRVSNVLEMVLYWERYDSFKGVSLARGDISETRALEFAKLQKLIESTEMNVNNEYKWIVDRSKCWYDTIDFLNMENDVNDWDMYHLFETRIYTLMISKEKYELIRSRLSLNSYDLYLHKALILSLDMIPYFDSERSSNGNNFSSFEECRLMSEGFFTDNRYSKEAIGLMVSSADDLRLFNRFIAISLEISRFDGGPLQIPDHIQFLCLNFICTEDVELDYLKGCYFPGVIDLSVKFPEHVHENMVRSILLGIKRERFPKLMRLSVKGIPLLENVFELDIIRNLLYLEVITQGVDGNYGETDYFQSSRIHDMIDIHFIYTDVLIHHLITHANFSIRNSDANYDSIQKYYKLAEGRFVASISHSSVNAHYGTCNE